MTTNFEHKAGKFFDLKLNDGFLFKTETIRFFTHAPCSMRPAPVAVQGTFQGASWNIHQVKTLPDNH